jgi:hypothetical protein
MPCFAKASQGEPSEAAQRRRRGRWDRRCMAIMTRHAAQCTNAELADLIAAETGQRFRPQTISEHRVALGLPSPRRNDWTAPLRRWRPWQGGQHSAQGRVDCPAQPGETAHADRHHDVCDGLRDPAAGPRP